MHLKQFKMSCTLLIICGCVPRSNNANVLDFARVRPPNEIAGQSVVYELQVRTANACDPLVGSAAQRVACSSKIAPRPHYRAEGMTCSTINDLNRIRLGTLEDIREPTNDFKKGITLSYIKNTVGANTIWLMPMHPNNDSWNIPDACDNLGSPYAVRDYLHIRGDLSRACIVANQSDDPDACYGNNSLDYLIADAHRQGIRVMMDLAFNHFGHNYRMYDTELSYSIPAILEKTGRFDFENFSATYDAKLLAPKILDSTNALMMYGQKEILSALTKKCPQLTATDAPVIYNMLQNAFSWEYEGIKCDNVNLEYNIPSFYAGQNSFNPSRSIGDNFTNNWTDVKFLYLQRRNFAHQYEYLRNREYLFRIVNYWLSRGVDGFRLDHTTDPDSGIDAGLWKYITEKSTYYAHLRGQQTPVFMAEEFHDQGPMANVVDAMTDGYVFDMRNGNEKDAGRIEYILNNMQRHQYKTHVMTALETHDEKRLVDGNTGFDPWVGAGFWAIGLTTWSMPMLLTGQEFGEPWGLGFRRSDFLRGRFQNSGNDRSDASLLTELYGRLIKIRTSTDGTALRSKLSSYLRTRDGGIHKNIFAQLKWTATFPPQAIFTFHNLWPQNSSASYQLDALQAQNAGLLANKQYRLVNLISGNVMTNCRSGSAFASDMSVQMNAETRLIWAKVEPCPNATILNQ